jgi:hypothetical protein
MLRRGNTLSNGNATEGLIDNIIKENDELFSWIISVMSV